VKEALYESVSMRGFVGIDLGQEAAPDETTVCKFRQLLERNKLGKKLLSTVNGYLARNGIKFGNGTIVDATIIGAPSSTKNTGGKRDPDMHQVPKGKQWYFGMKAHVGVDSRHKIIHTILASAANVSDVLALPHLLHGRETCVWGDQAYQGHTPSTRWRRVPEIAPTGAIASATVSMRPPKPRTATSRACVPRSSTWSE
jgi:IS5 family transposase